MKSRPKRDGSIRERQGNQEHRGQAPTIGTLYIQKWAASDATKLKVTIGLLMSLFVPL